MSIKAARQIRELLLLLQDAWAEHQALLASGAIEAARRSPDWERTLRTAKDYAEEAFQLVFDGLDHNAPLPPLLQQLRERLEASQGQQESEKAATAGA